MTTLEDKLVAAKLELQKMMTRSCWKDRWRHTATKWSEKIVIAADGANEGVYRIILPADGGGIYPLINCDRTTLLPRACGMNQTYDFDLAISYISYFGRLQLYGVPNNLAVDIFRHFVLAFGGKFLDGFARKDSLNAGDTYYQQLWVDEENKRHYQVIRDSLPQIGLFDLTNSTTTIDDRWMWVKTNGIQLGGKLQPVHYIEGLLEKRKSFQIDRMIEHYFHFDKSDEIVKTAKNFQKLLIHHSRGEVLIVIDRISYLLVGAVANISSVQNERKAAKTFDFGNENCEGRRQEYWNYLQKIPFFTIILGDDKTRKLTVEDVRFLVCCSIDAEYDYRETFDIVKSFSADAVTTTTTDNSSSLSSLSSLTTSTTPCFPSVDDDFSSFEFPLLRGLLAETTLSKKLASYAIGKEEISTGEFAKLAPSALTQIVDSYYSVDVH